MTNSLYIGFFMKRYKFKKYKTNITSAKKQ